MKKAMRWITFLLAAVLILSTTAMGALAEGKNLTVDAAAEVVEGAVYQDIQSAINYIDGQQDKTGWTITVKAGSYSRFTVLSGLDGLTVQAALGETVTVSTMDGSAAPAPVSGGYPETGGIAVRDADNVVLDGLNITMGSLSTPWYAAGVSTFNESVKGDNLTVRNCTFTGNGSTKYGLFINSGVSSFAVQNCRFSGVSDAIEIMCDGTAVGTVSVTGCTFTGCSFAVHGYYGGTNGGVFTFSNNVVAGTDSLRSKVILQDQVNTGALKANVTGNSFTNAVVGLVNLREAGETVSDVLSSNQMGKSSYYVEAVEPGTIDFYSSYQAPAGGAGRWVLTSIDDLEVGWGNNPAGTVEYVKAQIEKANAEGSRVLNITGIESGELIKTFTWFKDAIYWETIDAGNLTVAKNVTGNSGDQKYPFAFEVRIDGLNGTYGGMTFVDGVAAFTLSHGQSITATGIPAGLAYTVTETDAAGHISSAVGAAGVIVKDMTASAVFTNSRNEVAPNIPTPTPDPVIPTPEPVEEIPEDDIPVTEPGEEDAPEEIEEIEEDIPADEVPKTGDPGASALCIAALILVGLMAALAVERRLHARQR